MNCKHHYKKLAEQTLPSSFEQLKSAANFEVKDMKDKFFRKKYICILTCEICGDVGMNQDVAHPVECHEGWHYDDNKKTQTLKSLVALCPNCHKTKHVGLAKINGEESIVIKQLMKVNDMTEKEAKAYIAESFAIWQERCE